MSDRWAKASVSLHWLTVMLIGGLAAAGFVMTDLEAGSGLRLLLSRLHTLFGATLMVVTVARVVVRRRRPAPPPLPLSELHRRGVAIVYGLTYLLTFALGATGFVTAARSAWPSYLRGALAGAPALEQLASRQLHEALVYALLGLVGLHVGGVVVQQVRHGATLRRMVPFLK